MKSRLSNTVVLKSLLFLTAVALLALAPHARAQSYTLAPADPGDRQAARLQSGFADGLPEAEGVPLQRDRSEFLLPWFQVDRRSAGGLTTLLAFRNTQSRRGSDADVTYLDVSGEVLRTDHFELDPHEAVTVNLRDLPELEADADGIARGMVRIESFWNVSADYFAVDPAGNFATGGRLADSTCDVWDLRYLAGGGFDGGTTLQIYVREPLGTNAATAPPSARILVVNQAGDELGTVNLFAGDQALELTIQDILDALPGSQPPFGALVVDFADEGDLGYVQGTFTAENRFSIGMTATCLESN